MIAWNLRNPVRKHSKSFDERDMKDCLESHRINCWSTNYYFLFLLQFFLLGSCGNGASIVSAFGLIESGARYNFATTRGKGATKPLASRYLRLMERPEEFVPLFCKMTADATADASGKNAATETTKTMAVTNRLFLSHIDYKNYDKENESGDSDLSPEEVRQLLEDLFSKFGSVLEIYLSEKKDPGLINDKEQARSHPPFGFVAMETAEEARAALEVLGPQQHPPQPSEEVVNPLPRRLFRDVAPAHVHKSKQNKQNKNERLRSERAKEYRQRSAAIDTSNVVCQVHTSHVDRLQDYVSTKNGVSLVGSFWAKKGTSLLFLKVNDPATSPVDDNGDYLEDFSRSLWDTWFVAPNLNRITLLDDSQKFDGNNDDCDDNPYRIQGNLRKGVVPAIFKRLSEIEGSTVSLRVAIFPPKLQRTFLEGLEDYNQKRKGDENDCCKNMDIQFSPGNPTHSISIVQVHPGVVETPKSKGDNDKALYALGRLEEVPQTRKRFLSDDSNGSGDNKYRFQQQRTNQVPQFRKAIVGSDNSTSVAHNSNLKAIRSSTTPSDGNAVDSEDDKSISRAYWKLQEAWVRYKYEAPSLCERIPSDREPMWALDCGAAPGGWTKFLFRPGIVDRIFAVDPGALAPEVVPGLDTTHSSPTPIVRYVDETIQKALPELASELRAAADQRKNPFLDIWVSDMCVKDMEGQIDFFLMARSEGVIGAGTFFVLTLKCLLGYSATAFDQQTEQQVRRLDGISRDVHVVHLFSNRSSERTVIGYLV